MKKITYIIVVGLIATGFVSCSIDNVSNMSEQSTENFPVTDSDAIATLAGIYENLNAVHAYPQETFTYNAMLASDDQFGGGGTNDKLMQSEDLLCNYGTNMTNHFWSLRYQGINRANTLIQALPNTKLSDSKKAQYMGEALFLRAFYHYELASMYGNIPLMTAPSGNIVAQGDVKVLWGQIIQDLRDAAKTMPAKRLTDGHVDKYTAEAMLGRAWLFYTGMYCNGTDLSALVSTTYNPLTSVTLPDGSTLTKSDVAGYIDDCVNSSGYSLVSDFRNLWAYTNKYDVEEYSYTKGKGLKWVEDDNGINPESMFAVKFNKLASWNTTIGYCNGYALHFGMRGGQAYQNTFPFGQGWGAGPVATNLENDWNSADPNSEDIRHSATIQNVNDLPAYTHGGNADFVQETDYFDKKISAISCKTDTDDTKYYPVFELRMYGNKGWSNDNYMQTGNIHDFVMIRFADVLLMQSELEENVSGINKVRERAGLPDLTTYSLSALQNERRWEFACEGIRWNDIRRWHIAAEALDKQLNAAVYYCGAAGKNTAHNGGYSSRYNATAGFQKMPDDAVSIGSVVQNPGWTGSDSEYAGW
jgi:starch-binding outer membrane protein, SusD/RagB family